MVRVWWRRRAEFSYPPPPPWARRRLLISRRAIFECRLPEEVVHRRNRVCSPWRSPSLVRLTTLAPDRQQQVVWLVGALAFYFIIIIIIIGGTGLATATRAQHVAVACSISSTCNLGCNSIWSQAGRQ